MNFKGEGYAATENTAFTKPLLALQTAKFLLQKLNIRDYTHPSAHMVLVTVDDMIDWLIG